MEVPNLGPRPGSPWASAASSKKVLSTLPTFRCHTPGEGKSRSQGGHLRAEHLQQGCRDTCGATSDGGGVPHQAQITVTLQ